MTTSDFWEKFDIEMERIGPSSLAAHIDPTRPYDGQPHTSYGERGQTEVKGITFRDLQDCFMKACYLSSGLPPKEWPGTIYDLPWKDMDIIAVSQNLSCEVERMMGIFPNVPRTYPDDVAKPHWCGENIDKAEWATHDGTCDEPENFKKVKGSFPWQDE